MRKRKDVLDLFYILKKKVKLTNPDIHVIHDWTTQFWVSTGGTRQKKYLENHTGKKFYFKQSHYKPATANLQAKDYTYEFWSEIIAYHIGTLLGFHVLRYDIAIDKDEYGKELVGCISADMINSDLEELIQGIQYLQAFDPQFSQEGRDNRHTYNFQLIENTFDNFSLEIYKKDFLAMLVFDAIIGNGDRHQENWAFISGYVLEDKDLHKNLRALDENPNYRDWFYTPIIAKKTFAPIYDSGSSLGRELTSQRVDTLLKDDAGLLKYVDRGVSEIHWFDRKISHFELMTNLLNSKHKEDIREVLNRVTIMYDTGKIKNIIYNIDILLPDNLKQYKLPMERKLLIYKLVTLRSEKLLALI